MNLSPSLRSLSGEWAGKCFKELVWDHSKDEVNACLQANKVVHAIETHVPNHFHH
jgi:hypothetical protein